MEEHERLACRTYSTISPPSPRRAANLANGGDGLAHRQKPQLTALRRVLDRYRPDRAWLALLAGMLPAGRLAAMRLIVTSATILRWHRDIVRRRWARLAARPLRTSADAP